MLVDDFIRGQNQGGDDQNQEAAQNAKENVKLHF
jgi:hypothetical protein